MADSLPAAAAAAPAGSQPGSAAALAKLCAFCGGDASAYGGQLGRMQGPFFTSSKGHDAVYVHHECALWSPQITVDAWNRLQSVVREVRRARNLRCSVCDKPGAALGCRVPSCSRCFHLPCAIEHGCCFNFERYLMSCKEHSALFSKEPAGRQAKAVAGPLRHLKLSSRHLLSGLPKVFAGDQAAAAAAAVLGNSSAGSAGRRRARAASGSTRRNRMSAEELGSHMAAAEEAYLGLVDELRRGEESEDDDAVFARKNAKRFCKAEELLAPTLLKPPAAAAPRQQQPQQQPQDAPRPGSTLAHALLPAEAQQRYAQHMQQAAQLKRPVRHPQPQPQPPSQQQQQQHAGWQPSSEGFKGVGGLEDAKRQLKEMVLMPLTYPDLYRSLNIHPPRGILLHGPPGTGKTALVRALAAECAALSAQPSSRAAAAGGGGSDAAAAPTPVALFARKGTDCLGKYAGDAELHLRMLFEMAAASSPSIIFLDELDGLVPARSVRSGGSDQIFASIVSVLLALMDGLTDRGQVLVIGATNRPDNIDPALRRPGRFDREVFVGLPGAQHRADILALHTSKWRPPPPRQQLEHIAAQTEGWAGADLQALAAAALLAAVRRITPQLLDSMAAQQQQQQQQQGRDQQEPPGGMANPAQADATTASVGAAAAPETADDGVVAAAAAADGYVAGASASVYEQQQQQQQQQQQLPPLHTTSTERRPPARATPAAAGADGVAAAAAAGGLPDTPVSTGGFLAALHEFVTERRGSCGFLFSSPPDPTPPAGTQQPERSEQQPLQQQDEPQQQQAADVEQQQKHRQQQEHQQRQQHVASLFPVVAGSGLPPRPPQPRSVSTSRPAVEAAAAAAPAPAPAGLPAALTTLQVTAADWSAALAELGPPASKRGSHNLPALSPAAALPAALLPALLPALAAVVDTLQGWLLLGPADAGQWQQARGAGQAPVVKVPGVAGGAAAWLGSSSSSQGGDAGKAGEGSSAVLELLASWGVVQALPGSIADTAAGAAGTSLTAEGGDPLLQPSLPELLGGNSSLSGAPPGLQQQHSSSTPQCLLLSGHGAVGQSELAAATLKLLDSRAGAAVHTLSLPVMLLLGEGAAGAGLVAGVQEALGRSSSTQPLVIFMPRVELWALEAAKPAAKDTDPHTNSAAAAAGPHGAKRGQASLGGWCSGLRGAFSSSSSDSSDSSSDEEPSDEERGSSDGRRQRQQQRQQPGVQFSAAWSVFEQQLAMLTGQRRLLLLLATTQLPAERLPPEMQQLFGWQQQAQQQQEQQGKGTGVGGCSSSRTVQLRQHAGLAVLQSTLINSSGTAGADAAGGNGGVDQSPRQQHQRTQADTDASCFGALAPGSPQQQEQQQELQQQQQQPVDALIAAALQQKDQQRRQRRRQLPARVPTVQLLAAQQLGAPLKQLNDAQRAEAQGLLTQVQGALRQVASSVLQDPRLALTRTHQQQGSRAATGASRTGSAASSQQQHQEMLASAAGMAPQAVRELRGRLPLAAVCVKALQGFYWGLDAFQADFASAVDAVRPPQQQRLSAAGAAHSCASAAASTLGDMVAAACHEARQRLRLYDASRQQLLEAAALAALSVAQQQELQAEAAERRQVLKMRQPKRPAGGAAGGS